MAYGVFDTNLSVFTILQWKTTNEVNSFISKATIFGCWRCSFDSRAATTEHVRPAFEWVVTKHLYLRWWWRALILFPGISFSSWHECISLILFGLVWSLLCIMVCISGTLRHGDVAFNFWKIIYSNFVHASSNQPKIKRKVFLLQRIEYWFLNVKLK